MKPSTILEHGLPNLLAVFVGASVLLAWQVTAVNAQVQLSPQRAADGTVYEVLYLPTGSLSSSTDQFRITTVSGGTNGLGSCSQVGSQSGEPAYAISGANAVAGQSLYPLGSTLRSHKFSPSSLIINFNPTGSGRLIMGDSEVCRVSSNCSGGVTNVAVVGLTSSGGSVPAACVATASASCDGAATRTTFGFGLPALSNSCTSNPTVDTTICADQPSDGFLLEKGEVVVFIYNGNLAASGFSLGASGFGIDFDGVSSTCSGKADIATLGAVVTADGLNPSAPGAPQPTPGDNGRVRAPLLDGGPIAALVLILAAVGIYYVRRRTAS